jgi:hypothetical protein
MKSKEKKEQMFELYIDDLRYLGAEIPMLYWNVDADGDIYLLWGKISGELNKHLDYSEMYRDKVDSLVDYFNHVHKISDEDL